MPCRLCHVPERLGEAAAVMGDCGAVWGNGAARILSRKSWSALRLNSSAMEPWASTPQHAMLAPNPPRSTALHIALFVICSPTVIAAQNFSYSNGSESLGWAAEPLLLRGS